MELLNYTLTGDRHKPIMLFLHGFMGSGADFDAVVSRLSADFCCLTVDLPGHGKTKVKPELDYQMPAVAKAVVELLRQLNISQCFLLGYSMGGRLALYLTVYFPQLFIKVILESASPGLKTQVERDERLKQDAKLIDRLLRVEFSVFLEQWYQNPLFSSFRQHPNYHQAIAQRIHNNPHELAKSLQYMGLGVQPSLWDNLTTVQVPVLLIVGEYDTKFKEINHDLADLLPQAQLQLVKNSGHNVHFERSSQFARIIQDFCGKTSKKHRHNQ